ncbi:hypothetical protein GCM10008924_20620 [Gracilibacillus halotolerans]
MKGLFISIVKIGTLVNGSLVKMREPIKVRASFLNLYYVLLYQVFYTNLFVKCLISGKINVMDSDN